MQENQLKTTTNTHFTSNCYHSALCLYVYFAVLVAHNVILDENIFNIG